MTTPDIVLSFVLWVRRTRSSFWRRLLFRMKDLKYFSVWDISESGGFFHHYDNQHENCRYTEHEYPASRHYSIEYFPEIQLPLHRPQAYDFTNKSVQYPLLGTAKIITCPKCSGSGRVTCWGCGGSGSVMQTDHEGKSKNVTCGSCGGSGTQRCGRCSGEGKLLTYTSKDYIWKHTVDNQSILSDVTNRHSVRSLITKTHKKGGSYKISEFSDDQIIQATGVYNERIKALVEHAKNVATKKEQEIKNRFGVLLFQQHDRFYIPLGFINLFIAKQFGQYFVAGNLQHRRFNSPPFRWSLLKFLGWVAVGIEISLFAAVFHGSLVLTPQVTQLLAIGLGIVLIVGLLRFIRDFFLKWPNTWLIADNDGLGGWLFIHLIVQSISLNRKGKLLDPCYTDLFHLPEPNTRKSRNSFFCTIETGKDQERQTTELFLASQRALNLFGSDIQQLAQNIQTFIWVIMRQPTVAEIDNTIATLLKAQTDEKRKKSRLILIADLANCVLSRNDFPQISAYLSANSISLYSLPLLEAFEDLQQGKLSAKTENTLNILQKMLEPSTVLPANSEPTN